MENMPYASFWWRVLAHLIDSTLLLVLKIILGMALSLILVTLSVNSNILIGNIISKYLSLYLLKVVLSLLEILVYWLYFSLMESSAQQATLGKKLCHLKVTDTQGKKLTFGRASGRNWAKLVSSLTCLGGYIMAAFTARSQALHDIIAKTVVLREQG